MKFCMEYYLDDILLHVIVASALCHVTMYQAVIDFYSNEFCCLRTPIGFEEFVRVNRSREKRGSC
jgi:hypothetical protein